MEMELESSIRLKGGKRKVTFVYSDHKTFEALVDLAESTGQKYSLVVGSGPKIGEGIDISAAMFAITGMDGFVNNLKRIFNMNDNSGSNSGGTEHGTSTPAGEDIAPVSLPGIPGAITNESEKEGGE